MFAEEGDKINDMNVDNNGNIYLATSSGFVHKFVHRHNNPHNNPNKFQTNFIEPTIS